MSTATEPLQWKMEKAIKAKAVYANDEIEITCCFMKGVCCSGPKLQVRKNAGNDIRQVLNFSRNKESIWENMAS